MADPRRTASAVPGRNPGTRPTGTQADLRILSSRCGHRLPFYRPVVRTVPGRRLRPAEIPAGRVVRRPGPRRAPGDGIVELKYRDMTLAAIEHELDRGLQHLRNNGWELRATVEWRQE